MKRSFPHTGIRSVLTLTAVLLGCTPSNKVPAGAPIMVSFLVVGPTGEQVELVTEAGAATVPPLSKFYALFDRLLDPTALATIDADSGALTPNNGVAVVGWSGGSVAADALYIPNGDAKFTLIPALFGLPFANGPSLTITPQLGLPSGSNVTVDLDATKVRSHDQKTPFEPAADVERTLMFVTDPLMVTVDVPPVPEPPDGGADDGGAAGDGGTGPGVAPPVDPDYVAHVVFNNLTADATAAQIQVTGTSAGVPIAALGAMVARDDMNPAAWTVSPPTDGWPAGAVVTINIGAAAADNFAQTLGSAVSASFTVKP